MRSGHRNGPSGGNTSGRQQATARPRPAPVASSEADRDYPAWLDDISEGDLVGDA